MSQQQPSRSSNRRRGRRSPAKGATKVVCYRNALGLGPNIARGVSDISETGVRLFLKEELAVGKEVQIELEAPGCRPVKMPCVVVWVLPEPDGGFRAGLRFEKGMRWADVMALART